MNFAALLVVLLIPFHVLAQTPGEGGEKTEAVEIEGDDFRNTTGYVFPPLSATVRDMQFMAYAFTLRDYCADRRIPDAWVKERLARFSAMTGRDETCRSLLDY